MFYPELQCEQVLCNAFVQYSGDRAALILSDGLETLDKLADSLVRVTHFRNIRGEGIKADDDPFLALWNISDVAISLRSVGLRVDLLMRPLLAGEGRFDIGLCLAIPRLPDHLAHMLSHDFRRVHAKLRHRQSVRKTIHRCGVPRGNLSRNIVEDGLQITPSELEFRGQLPVTRFAGTQFFRVAMALNDHGGEISGDFYQVFFGARWRARVLVVHRASAEQYPSTIHQRYGPTGAEPVLSRQVCVLEP